MDSMTRTGRAGEAGGVRLRWLAFSAALAAAMMDLLDATVVNTAAPDIRVDLGGSFADVQWLAAGYTLAMAVMLLIGGRLGDLFGRKRMLLVGVAGFAVASVAAAAAPSTGALIAFRIVQGAVGAVMVPQVFGLIRDLFPPHEMGKAWGVFGPVMGLSAMLGPIVAGGLINADLLGTGWRMIFLVNVPRGRVRAHRRRQAPARPDDEAGVAAPRRRRRRARHGRLVPAHLPDRPRS